MDLMLCLYIEMQSCQNLLHGASKWLTVTQTG
jgi:hypothetical protein